MRHIFKYLVMVVSLFAFTNLASLPVSAFEPEFEESPETNTIESCGFPRNKETLLSYAAEDAVWPELQQSPFALAIPIPAGTYSITATSYDGHSIKHNPTQEHEQWQFWAYGQDATTPIFYSRYTDDLPDDQDVNTTNLQSYVHFEETVYYIRYVHFAYSNGLEILNFQGRAYDALSNEEKATVQWHSIQPTCLNFKPVVMVTCDSLLTTASKETVGLYDIEVQVTNVNNLPIATNFDFGDGDSKTIVGTKTQHSYNKDGQYIVKAHVMHDGVVIAKCQKTTVVASGRGGAVLGASTQNTTTNTSVTTSDESYVLPAGAIIVGK